MSLVERVARTITPSLFEPFDPKIHGSPVNQKNAQPVYEVRNLPVAWRVVNPMRSSVRVEAAA